ncbi:MAG: nucleoside triphosphate pyrophosphohydrolase [Bacteroidota bacterium]|jgi:MazG family protein
MEANHPAAGAFLRLLQIMDELREKCPWDKKQTEQTLRPLTIEETYELADAITKNDWQGIREELGDLMLHLVFYTRIAQEQGRFTMDEVIHGICDKLISRHPHVYGDVQVKDEDDVKKNWEQLKMREGKKSVLGGVPVSLPALVKAIRIQEKAKQVGFEWENRADVWKKVEEETAELQEAIAQESPAAIEEEYGDLLFSLVNYARFLQVDPEGALERTNQKFIRRFQLMEAAAAADGRSLHNMSLQEMDELWNKSKQHT